jgi:hypothetical protein
MLRNAERCPNNIVPPVYSIRAWIFHFGTIRECGLCTQPVAPEFALVSLPFIPSALPGLHLELVTK